LVADKKPPWELMNDPDIIVALKQGKVSAIDEIIRIYGDRLLRSACLLSGNQTDAQDLVQDTLVQVMQSIQSFRGESLLYTWMHGILLNLIRRRLRQQSRLEYNNDLPDQMEAPPPMETERLDLEKASSAMRKALQALSPPHREIIVLRYFEAMKIEEIARHLRISMGTAKSRLHYATQCLRNLMPENLNLFRS